MNRENKSCVEQFNIKFTTVEYHNWPFVTIPWYDSSVYNVLISVNSCEISSQLRWGIPMLLTNLFYPPTSYFKALEIKIRSVPTLHMIETYCTKWWQYMYHEEGHSMRNVAPTSWTYRTKFTGLDYHVTQITTTDTCRKKGESQIFADFTHPHSILVRLSVVKCLFAQTVTLFFLVMSLICIPITMTT